MSIRRALEATLTAPTAADLWRLRAELLEAGLRHDSRVWPVLNEFQSYLDELATSTSSKQYSELASKLDIGAVGGVLVEQLLEESSREELVLRLLSGVLSEGLMILATRQHIRAWKGELEAVHRSAAWYLYQELWRRAEERKPDLPAAERRRLLDRLFEPVHSDATDSFSKAVLLGLLFQTVVIGYLSQEMSQLPG